MRNRTRMMMRIATPLAILWGMGAGPAVSSDAPVERPLPKLLDHRLLTFTAVVRVRQIETTRDSAEGPDETSIHSPAIARAFRDTVETSWPGARITCPARIGIPRI